MTTCDLPETPVSRLLIRWLDAINGDDKDHFRAVCVELGLERIKDLDRLMVVKEATGGFVVAAVEMSDDLHIGTIIRARKGETYSRLIVETSASDPARMSALSSTVLPDWPIPERMTTSNTISALVAEADLRCAGDMFSGVVLVAKDNIVLFEKAFGLADREAGTPVTLETSFRIASVGKMFTAVAIHQLIDAGMLSMSATVGQLIPGYPSAEVAEKVTIWHLLSHTSGTGEIITDEYWEKRPDIREHDDYLALYGEAGLSFEPGTKFIYSNYGYVLLGIIIERLTGRSYHDYIRQSIFERLGMSSTNTLPECEDLPKRSIGYTKYGGGEWSSTTHFMPWRATAAGGANSTAGDLFRFAGGLIDGKLIKLETLAEATRVQYPGSVYGLGFAVEEEGGVTCIGHSGGMAGMNAVVYIMPAPRIVIIAVANLDPPAATHLANFVRARLPMHEEG